MRNLAAAGSAIGRMQQRLHRQELKLARLKNALDKNRQADTRLKLRLGGLLYLVGLENLTERDLEQTIERIKMIIQSADDNGESLQAVGEKFLVSQSQIKINPTLVNDNDRQELAHKKITKGGMMVKYQLQKFEKATVVGALLREIQA